MLTDKLRKNLPTCYWCGNTVLEGHGERARVITDNDGVKHFHYDPEHGINCAQAYINAMEVMEQMEESELDLIADRGYE